MATKTKSDDPLVVLPHSVEAEEAVLGALLIDRDAIIKISTILKPEDFYRPMHAQIYGAVLALYERREPPDIALVAAQMATLDEAPTYLAELARMMTAVPTAVHVEHYAQVVKRASIKRQVIVAGTKVVNLGYNPAIEADEAVRSAYDAIATLTTASDNGHFVPLTTVLEDLFEKLDVLQANRGEIVGLPTGYIDLDRLTGGFHRSDLIVVAGRPGAGKTALGLGFTANIAAATGLTVGIFSLEMSSEQLGMRLLSMETGIDSGRLRVGDIKDDEWEKVSLAFGNLSQGKVFISDQPGLSIGDVRQRARQLQAEHGLDCLMIDYLQLLSGSKESAKNRVVEVAQVSSGLKQLARELHIPVIALAQLGRGVEGRASHVPMLQDLRESGSIENDADMVIFIYREEMYDTDTDKKGVAELHIAKHRSGPVGVVSLAFFDKSTRFASMEAYRTPPSGNGRNDDW